MNLKQLFSPTPSTASTSAPQIGDNQNQPPIPPASTVASPAHNGLAKKQSETYTAWGTRYAGATNATPQALTPALHQVILTEQQRQKNDIAQQAQHKKQLQANIDTCQNNIDQANTTKNGHQSTIENLKKQIDDKKQEIEKIKLGGGLAKGGRAYSKVLFYLFAVVTVGLGLYLYLFYGSAAYSAFFCKEGSVNNVSEALFNSNAFALAWEHGFFAAFLILLFPTIFVALGVMLHVYSSQTENEGTKNYLKIAALFTVAFIFDALLAYKISEMFYTPTREALQYTIPMAFKEANFWFVIFCGFISYIIWGLIFGQTMKNYQELLTGKITIDRLEKEILQCEDQIKDLNKKIADLTTQITKWKNDIIQYQQTINNQTAIINWNVIKKCLNQFFSGWIAYMNLVGMGQESKSQAQSILNGILQEINNQFNNQSNNNQNQNESE